jgi:hypothetical protein
MKNLKAMAFATLVLASLTLGACSGNNANESKEAKIKGIYLSPAVMSYSNMRPTYNYYLTTFTQEELTLFDNNTYCLVVSSSQFSAVVLDENTNDFSGNERANYLYKFYGECTSVVNDIDEDLLDVTLKSVSRYIASYDQQYWLDTDNWTEEMGKKVIPPKGIDTTTGQPIPDTEADPWSAKQYLDSKQFASDVEIQVNVKTYSFDFAQLEFAEAK